MKRRWLLVSALVFGFLGVMALYLWREASLERRFLPQIRMAAQRYGVDPALVEAVVWRESRFHPDRRGSHGELGLMQIQDNSALEWADAEHIHPFEHASCLDPGTNLLAGTYYLSTLLKRYRHTDNPIPYALADYNAGRSNVLKWNKGAAATNSALFIQNIGFPGTKKYVKQVMKRYAHYRRSEPLEWRVGTALKATGGGR